MSWYSSARESKVENSRRDASNFLQRTILSVADDPASSALKYSGTSEIRISQKARYNYLRTYMPVLSRPGRGGEVRTVSHTVDPVLMIDITRQAQQATSIMARNVSGLACQRATCMVTLGRDQLRDTTTDREDLDMIFLCLRLRLLG